MTIDKQKEIRKTFHDLSQPLQVVLGQIGLLNVCGSFTEVKDINKILEIQSVRLLKMFEEMKKEIYQTLEIDTDISYIHKGVN